MNKPFAITTADLALDASRFSEFIDVRSPSEFAEDALPGAINLPVMDDEERTRIGTIYKQDSRFRARREGAAIVASRAAEHLRGHFSEMGGEYFPLVYCWRGGMRSGSLATILAAVGWRVGVLEGGYRAYRGELVRWFAEDLPQRGLRFIVVAGLTGSAKTHVLHALAEAGEQALDLEGRANHRGSLLGNEPDAPQPSQRRFEGFLFEDLRGFDPSRPVFVEAESHRIGNLQVPPALWKLLRESEVVELTVPLTARRDFLLRTYPHFTADPDLLLERLSCLESLHGKAIIEEWARLARAGHWEMLVDSLLATHYDPAYRRSRLKLYREARATGLADSLLPAEIPFLAETVRQAAYRE